MIFNPYHQFTNIDLFLDSFENLKTRQVVSPQALAITHYCSSVRIKLRNSKTYLDNLLAIKEWSDVPFLVSSAPIYSTSGSNSTLTVGTSAQVPSVQAMNLSMNLDGFFDSLASALDMFAHSINLVYFAPPRRPNSIGFDYIAEELRNEIGTRNEPISMQLNAMRRANWYKEMKPFRRCAIHYTSIDFQIDYKSSFGPLRGTSSAYTVNAILLPDNPLRVQSSYNKRRRVSTFCARLLKRELEALDNAFSLMNNKIIVVGRIPV